MEGQPVYMLTQEQVESLVKSVIDRFEKRIDYIIAKTRQDEKKEYTYDEFCEKYNCCPATIRNWYRNGIVNIREMGKKRYVTIIDQSYMDKRTIKQLTKL